MKNYLFALLLSSSAAPAAHAAEAQHFATVFAFQSETDTRQAHTFAVFTQLTPRSDGAELRTESDWDVASAAISWLPRELPMCISCPPVPGHNYTLAETFRIAASSGARVTVLPTIAVSARLYDEAVRQRDRLSQRSVYWVTVDPETRPNAFNCLHAVSDVNVSAGPLFSGFAHGVPGSQLTLRHLAAGNEIPGVTPPAWLPHALGYDSAPLSTAGR